MYIFIINPKAGSGRALKVFSDIQNSAVYRQMDSQYFFTEYEGHGEAIARKISADPEGKTIIVVGGDGTIHEVMNGLISTEIRIAFIPAGSGNDFARGCGIKGKPEEILRKIIEHNMVRPYWIGNYTADGYGVHKFVNSIGFGFDAAIAHAANQSSYRRFLNALGLGTLSYVIALIYVLMYYKPMSMELEIDNEKRILKDCWMVTIANHPYYGGGMKIIPTAVIQPNVFPLLIIHSISKWKVLALFITVFLGIHTRFKEVEILEATTLKITAETSIPFQTDGQTGKCSSSLISKQKEAVHITGINEAWAK
ncbi:diacylglycerol kinase family protein [Oceanobacillus profundus]|uniref:diacylglycerol/lipid kinase family protein n=1 Tax=Oceanobacillus TaxID=182709 RepID=UPI0026E3F328|nr:diacylglycerol kinase family protein [Oceanobacillus profundus]MBR3120058.1 diacylglycerol kinase family lipid kinase [Oceanobacillus sp.]MDO6451815.1 diacylglycerol kinase family lipid kinase [Oceanobacillus profundus]